MEYVVGWLIFSIVAGVIASSRGRSGLGFFALSLVLSPLIGIILAVGMPSLAARPNPLAGPEDDYTRCDECRELVRWDARKCKHCGAALVPHEMSTPAAQGPDAWDMAFTGLRVVIGLLGVGVVLVIINAVRGLT